MGESVLIGLTGIIVLGIGAQWLAWRFKLPSIIFLLVMGFLVGPVLQFLKPDQLFGDVLLPLVSISVAIILFEGGLGLRLKELKEIGGVVRNLITVGAALTWFASATAAHFLLKTNWKISLLSGAVLIVTGPTVIGPLLQLIRPSERVSNILKWEGIVIDPIGALLAMMVFEAILIGQFQKVTALVLFSLLKTIVVASLIGVAGARLLVLFLKRYWIPDFLQETAALMLVITVFTAANMIQAESGLFAVTLMGLALDNQKKYLSIELSNLKKICVFC